MKCGRLPSFFAEVGEFSALVVGLAIGVDGPDLAGSCDVDCLGASPNKSSISMLQCISFARTVAMKHSLALPFPQALLGNLLPDLLLWHFLDVQSVLEPVRHFGNALCELLGRIEILCEFRMRWTEGFRIQIRVERLVEDCFFQSMNCRIIRLRGFEPSLRFCVSILC
jgi:hypothetical protein